MKAIAKTKILSLGLNYPEGTILEVIEKRKKLTLVKDHFGLKFWANNKDLRFK